MRASIFLLAATTLIACGDDRRLTDAGAWVDASRPDDGGPLLDAGFDVPTREDVGTDGGGRVEGPLVGPTAEFAHALALSPDGLTLAVGDENDVHAFRRASVAEGFRAPPVGSLPLPAGAISFGASLAFAEYDGVSLFVGDPRHSPGGAFHRFRLSGSGFGPALETVVASPDAFHRMRNRRFGTSITTITHPDGDLRVLVGDEDYDASGDGDNERGGVLSYAFDVDGVWRRRTEWAGLAGGPHSNDYGCSISAASGFAGSPSVVVVVGDQSSRNWVSIQSDGALSSLESGGNRSYFYGTALALRADARLLVVGDPGPQDGGADHGRLFVWTRAGRLDDFELTRTIEAPGDARAFGRSLAMADSTGELFVGAHTADGLGAVFRLTVE